MTRTADSRVLETLREVKALAKEYYALTGRPLGVTGEVAEFEAARLLKLRLAPARQAGFDAVEGPSSREIRYQIKGRCIRDGPKRGQRVGQIKLAYEWDRVLLVLLDEEFEAVAIYEANRESIRGAIEGARSKAHQRGALSISKFKQIAIVRWTRPTGSGA